ncbi:MAG TPA: hypothetical protein VKT82_14525 [Ktedonobacterales bacterium]|nr:hypothetical protein [Ktedonobacterales bacterium]
MPAESDNQIAQPISEAEPTLAAEQQWNSAVEEEWNEHSATSWALAYVIHRIRSTPHPPILLPEQRRHFEKVVEMAAALIEQWQGHERDLAQQLGTRRPITDLPEDPAGTSQDGLNDQISDDAWIKPAYTSFAQLLLGDDDEEASADAPKAPGTPAAEDDYQI